MATASNRLPSLNGTFRSNARHITRGNSDRDGYYARLRNMDGVVGSIIDNHGEYRGGQVILNVKDSDKAVELSGDCTFTRR